MAIVGTLPVTYTDGNILTAANLTNQFNAVKSDVNTNAVSKSDSGQTVSANITFSAGLTLGGNVTVTAAALKVIAGATSISFRNTADTADNLLIADGGNITVRGTLSGITTLTATTAALTTLSGTPNFSGTPTFGSGFTVTAGTATVGTLAATTLSGTPNFSGTPTFGAGFTITTGTTTITGDLTFSGASRKILPGTTAFIVRNVGNSADAISVAAATVTVGGAAVDVLLGATSLLSTATVGFARLPTLQTGIPTGVVSDGYCALEPGNNRVWFYSGGWKSVTVT